MDRNPLKVDQNQSDLLEKGSKLSQFNQNWWSQLKKLMIFVIFGGFQLKVECFDWIRPIVDGFWAFGSNQDPN